MRLNNTNFEYHYVFGYKGFVETSLHMYYLCMVIHFYVRSLDVNVLRAVDHHVAVGRVCVKVCKILSLSSRWAENCSEVRKTDGWKILKIAHGRKVFIIPIL